MTAPPDDAAPATVEEDGDAVLAKIRAAARACIKQGLRVIPIPRSEKAPKDLPGWPKERITEAEVDQRFSKPCNMGGLWGKPSGWLIDIDLDSAKAVQAAPFFFEKTLTY